MVEWSASPYDGKKQKEVRTRHTLQRHSLCDLLPPTGPYSPQSINADPPSVKLSRLMIEPQVPTSQHPGDQDLTAKPLGALYAQAVIIFISIFFN